jgi:hypothetical protein
VFGELVMKHSLTDHVSGEQKCMLRVGQGPPPWGNMGQRPPAGGVLMAFTATCIL